MITLETLQQTVRDAVLRASWIHAPLGMEGADADIPEGRADRSLPSEIRSDLGRLDTMALSGSTEDGWRFVIVSFSIEERGFPEGTRGYDGMATRGTGLIVHLTHEEAEACFKLAMRGMN